MGLGVSIDGLGARREHAARVWRQPGTGEWQFGPRPLAGPQGLAMSAAAWKNGHEAARSSEAESSRPE
eukprot:7198803-Pyramimonas_sp.AAC.1